LKEGKVPTIASMSTLKCYLVVFLECLRSNRQFVPGP
jgi:hypothetical protein